MKKFILVSILSVFVISVSAQSSIDKLFDKYAGQDGFVTISINGNLLKLAAAFGDEDDDEFLKHADKFTTIRILAQEDDFTISDNFYDMVIDEVSRMGYEEMMTINSHDSDVKILVKADGKIFREFVLVAGGDENAIIQIKGNLSYNEVKEMSESVKDGKGIHASMFN